MKVPEQKFGIIIRKIEQGRTEVTLTWRDFTRVVSLLFATSKSTPPTYSEICSVFDTSTAHIISRILPKTSAEDYPMFRPVTDVLLAKEFADVDTNPTFRRVESSESKSFVVAELL